MATKSDILEIKELLLKIKDQIPKVQAEKEWAKSPEVKAILGCSNGTLQSLRIKGKLSSKKVLGTHYYKLSDVRSLLNAGNK